MILKRLAYIETTALQLSNQKYTRFRKQKKKTIKIFKDIGFKITIDNGATICNLLDITLDLTKNVFKPYKKENTEIRYINSNSKHPKIIKKKLTDNGRK